jgi:hypothetical protein
VSDAAANWKIVKDLNKKNRTLQYGDPGGNGYIDSVVTEDGPLPCRFTKDNLEEIRVCSTDAQDKKQCQ